MNAFETLIGKKVRIDCMAGEPQYTGKTGTVTCIDAAGQVHGTWGGCALIPGTDAFTVLEDGADGALRAPSASGADTSGRSPLRSGR